MNSSNVTPSSLCVTLKVTVVSDVPGDMVGKGIGVDHRVGANEGTEVGWLVGIHVPGDMVGKGIGVDHRVGANEGTEVGWLVGIHSSNKLLE